MRYEVKGGSLPVLLCQLEAGETIWCESGAMSWMDDEIEMKTEGGGFGKVLGRLVTNEALFENTYYANRAGEIAFASKFPGSISAVRVTPQRPIIVQKGAYLARIGHIQTSVYFQKKLSRGLFGGEGFIMTQFSGDGYVFLEIDGSAVEYDIPAGDKKIIDTGYLAMMAASCTMDIRQIQGMKNIFLGGEGLFNTVVNGPGHIILQTMPVNQTALMLYNYMPHPSSN